FLTEKPWAIDLCGKIGLGDQLIGSNDPERKTYIVARGKLVVMPDGLMFMVPTKIMPTVLSPLFSWRTKLGATKRLPRWSNATTAPRWSICWPIRCFPEFTVAKLRS